MFIEWFLGLIPRLKKRDLCVKVIPKIGRPLITIACLMKNYARLVVSAAALAEESALTAEESALTAEESAFIAEESAFTEEESAALASALELLQAAKAAIAATNKNFFICDFFTFIE